MSDFYNLTALSPLDGRYARQLERLRPIFSEFGLLKRRVTVEIAWLTALCAEPRLPEARPLTALELEFINRIATEFTLEDAQRIKDIEVVTNHDVKALEYFIKEKLNNTTLEPLGEFIHFACTSEDINNVAHALMLRDGLAVLRAAQEELTASIAAMAEAERGTAMLARTHGQPASPTTIGKELALFVERLRSQAAQLDAVKIPAKLNGAVGNYSAHVAAAPDVAWPELARKVIEEHFGLTQNRLTTQIEPHDGMAALFDAMARWNTVLLDFNRDIWTYISMGYLAQKSVAGEVGSSTMPHKINPIDFENSEGNIGIANALLQHMARKLPVSRLQRDLSDSTVLRNMGVAFGHSLLATLSTTKGIGKITPNHTRLAQDLDNAWEVLAEPIQTVMRRHGKPNPYEQLKELTRGKPITAVIMQQFINGLDLPTPEKERLLALTPAGYTGMATQLTELIK